MKIVVRNYHCNTIINAVNTSLQADVPIFLSAQTSGLTFGYFTGWLQILPSYPFSVRLYEFIIP